MAQATGEDDIYEKYKQESQVAAAAFVVFLVPMLTVATLVAAAAGDVRVVQRRA